MFARALLFVVVVLGLGACEDTNHESIDKWKNTEKGPEKLRKALADDSLDADLSAHAALNLIAISHDPEVRTAFDAMPQQRRTAVLGKLIPRLWDVARIERDDALPLPAQTVAKDMLIHLRKHADDTQRQQIDAYLVDWYGVVSYEARARVGSMLGPAVMRLVGPPGGAKLNKVLDGIIAAPGQDKAKIAIKDDLLLGMAASGNPDSVKYLTDLARLDRGDPTLAKRAIRALYLAFVNPDRQFDLVEPAPLVPNLDALVSIAKDEAISREAANDAIDLIRATGSPHCQAPLLGMLKTPHPDRIFRYQVAQKALLCGGTPVIGDVVRALPESGDYAGDDIRNFIVSPIASITPAEQVKPLLRELLSDRSKVARWVAAEALVAMKSTEDVGKIAGLGTSSDRLTGYWGPAEQTKRDPTLGQRAKELAAQLGGK